MLKDTQKAIASRVFSGWMDSGCSGAAGAAKGRENWRSKTAVAGLTRARVSDDSGTS